MVVTTRGAARRQRGLALLAVFPDILLIVAQNGFLKPGEIAAVGKVSRILRAVAKTDDIWETLCLHEWPNTAAVPREVVERCGGGYRGLFLLRVAYFVGSHENVSSPDDAASSSVGLGSPSVTADDLVLLVDFKIDGKSLVSDAITGDALKPLLENGAMVHVPPSFGESSPIMLGEVERWLDDDDLPEDVSTDRSNTVPFGPEGYNNESLDASMHLIRLTDSSIRCVYMPFQLPHMFPPRAGLLDEGHTSGVPSLDVNTHETGYIDMGLGVQDGNVGLPLRHSVLTSEITSRFSRPIAFALCPELRICPVLEDREEWCELNVAIVSFAIRTVKYMNIDKDEDSFEWEGFNSEEEEHQHGVTISHLFGELQDDHLRKAPYF